MDEEEIIEIIEDVIYDEKGIDFLGIMMGKYLRNDIKDMLVDSLVKGLREKIK